MKLVELRAIIDAAKVATPDCVGKTVVAYLNGYGYPAVGPVQPPQTQPATLNDVVDQLRGINSYLGHIEVMLHRLSPTPVRKVPPRPSLKSKGAPLRAGYAVVLGKPRYS